MSNDKCLEIKSDRADYFVFDSMTDFTDWCDPNSFSRNSKSFVGEELRTWEEVKARSERSWAEGMFVFEKYIEDLRKAALPEVKDTRRQVHFDGMEGDEVDYDRLMNGEEFWRQSKRQSTDGPNDITIVIDTSTAANKDPMDILWRGAAALALTHLLEEKGYHVELWVVGGSCAYDRRANYGVVGACRLKRASDPLDASTIVNQVAGWFFRTVTFTLWRTACRLRGHGVADGLGRPYTPNQKELSLLSIDEHRVYVSGVFSYDGALRVVREELEALSKGLDADE